MNNVHLMGSEEVGNAGRNIRSAAEALQQAANTMSEAAERMRQVLSDFDFTIMNHQRFMAEWTRNLHLTLQEIMPDLSAPLAVRIVPDDDIDSVDIDTTEADLTKAPTERPPPNNSDRPTMPSPFCCDTEEQEE